MFLPDCDVAKRMGNIVARLSMFVYSIVASKLLNRFQLMRYQQIRNIDLGDRFLQFYQNSVFGFYIGILFQQYRLLFESKLAFKFAHYNMVCRKEYFFYSFLIQTFEIFLPTRCAMNKQLGENSCSEPFVCLFQWGLRSKLLPTDTNNTLYN